MLPGPRYSRWRSRNLRREGCAVREGYVGIVDVRRDVGIPICSGMRGEIGGGVECVAGDANAGVRYANASSSVHKCKTSSCE